MADIRHAIRAIARTPLVTSVVIVSLAVGIGVNTLVFAWIQTVILRPLPGVTDATGYHLVEPRSDAGAYIGTSWPEYLDLRERLTTFRGLIAFRMVPAYVGAPGRVERTYGLLVSGNYFGELGLQAAAGRLFAPGDAVTSSSEPVVVISHDYWRTRFAAQASAIGRSLRVNGRELTIVGVAPRGFQGTVLGLTFDLWMPATLAPELLPGSRERVDRRSRGFAVMGRLQPGVSRAQAQANLDFVMRQLSATYPASNASTTGEVLSFNDAPRGPQRFLGSALLLLQAATLLLLLMVCGNTANVMLVRVSARQRDIGVRLALGASPSRIVRLVMVESLLLALGGCALGSVLAWWGTDALGAIPPLRGLPIRFQTSVGWTGLLLTLGLGAASAVVFGALPAIQFARMDPHIAVRQGVRTASRSSIRDGVMAAQAGLAVIVLIFAGLFVRGFLQTRDVDAGFRREGVLLAAYDLTGRDVTAESARTFADRVLRAAQAVSGVESVAIATSVPLDIHGLGSRSFRVEGHARTDATEERATANTVTSGYFDVMDIPLVIGRTFADLSDVASPPEVIINGEFARRYLTGLEPIGRRVISGGRTFTIVGVARDSLYNAFGEPPTAALYFSFRDLPSGAAEIHVRTRAGHETVVAPAVRAAVASIDQDLPLYNVRTLSEHIENNLVFRRVPARLFAVLGPLVLALAAFGIYAVVSFSVARRTSEIGIRMALGATGPRIIRALIFESLRAVGIGAMVGWLAAFVVVVDVLVGVADLTVFITVPLLLVAVAALASWLPARTAAALDPMLALRRD